MHFAHFSHIWCKPGMTPHQRYEQLWRELQLCDETGFEYSFCVEHHFRPDESWMSSPSLYAVGAGARTKRLRIGPMGYIVPLYHKPQQWFVHSRELDYPRRLPRYGSPLFGQALETWWRKTP